ncbi:hypothetical protein AC1031_002387 [Aphanomyces cochlioides]|nr:hypothetical protein AC1031_002387 [Aphanomyces cochlioides]
MEGLAVELYRDAVKTWPSNGQAYNAEIAEALLRAQCFHSPQVAHAGFIMTRMTWIKPNFLWMMYRSSWASARNQERIVALKLQRQGFEQLVQTGVVSSFYQSTFESKDEWRTQLSASNVRIQWDPDHRPSGAKHPTRRAIQIGVRGEALLKLSTDMLDEIIDVTPFVHEQQRKDPTDDSVWLDNLIVPVERIYDPLQSSC